MTFELLTIPQAASKLGISPASVRRLADSGKIVAIRPMGPSGHRKIVGESIDRYLESLVDGASVPMDGAHRDADDSVDFDSILSRAMNRRFSNN